MKLNLLCHAALASMAVCSLPSYAASSAPKTNAAYSKDFVAGFQKGSNDARAYAQSTAKELDATYNFSKFAVDGQLPPALRNVDKDAPLVYRCNMTGRGPVSFSVIAAAQPLCKATNASGVCTATLSWRDFLTKDLAPENLPGPPSTLSVERQKDFNSGEEAAKSTALDNLRILSELYAGMGTYRTLESCGNTPVPSK